MLVQNIGHLAIYLSLKYEPIYSVPHLHVHCPSEAPKFFRYERIVWILAFKNIVQMGHRNEASSEASSGSTGNGNKIELLKDNQVMEEWVLLLKNSAL